MNTMYSLQLFFEAFLPFSLVIASGAVVIAAMLLWNCLKPAEE